MPEAEPLEQEIRLDFSSALDSVKDLETAFEAAASNIQELLSQAISNAIETAGQTPVSVDDVDASTVTDVVTAAVDAGATEPVTIADADAGAVETAIVDAVDAGSAAPAVIDGDAGNVTDAIDAAVAGATDTITVTADADTSAAENAISQLDGQSTTVTVDADTTDATAALDELQTAAENLDLSAAVNLDTGDAEKQLDGIGQSAESATAGLGVASGAVQGFTKRLSEAGPASNELKGALGALGPEGAVAAGGVAVVVGGLAALTKVGADVISVQQQLHATFGNFAKDVKNINVAGLNADLGDLAISLGVDDEAALSAATKVGALGQSLGQSQRQAAEFTKNVVAIAASVSSANPALGDLDTVTARIGQTLARNPAGLKRLGIEITPAELDAVATSLGKVPAQLSQADKAAIAAQIAISKIGDASDEVAARQQNAGVVFAATSETIKNLFEAIAVPVAIPVLKALQSFLPLLKALTPIASAFGTALSTALKGSTSAFAAFLKIVAIGAENLGRFIETANKIPVVGRAIPDDLGDKVFAFGESASSAADEALKLAKSGNDITSSMDNVSTSTSGAAAGIDAVGGASGNAVGGVSAFQSAVNDLTTSATSALPTSTEAFDNWQSSIKTAFQNVADAAGSGPQKIKEATDAAVAAANPAAFLAQLDKEIQDITDFQSSLSILIRAGFTDLVKFLEEKGPEAAGSFAKTLASDPALASATDARLKTLKTASENEIAYLDTVANPAIAAANVRIGVAATQAFDGSYNLAATTATQGDGAVLAIQAASPGISTATAEAALAADKKFEQGLGLPTTAAKQTSAAATAVTAGSPKISTAAGTAGSDASTSFTSSMDIVTKTNTALSGLTGVFSSVPGGPVGTAASAAGVSLGVAMAAGTAQGIALHGQSIEKALQDAIAAAHARAQRLIDAGSPSRLFAKDVGEPIGQGIAVGIASTENQIVAATNDVITAASKTLASADLIFPAVSVPTANITGALVSGATSGGSGTTNITFNVDLTINTTGDITPAQADDAGRLIADAAARQLARRDVIAQVRANA